MDCNPQIDICTFSATPTIYGWAALWNSTLVPNGSYTVSIYCGQCGFNNAVTTSMDVDNPTATVVLPGNNGTLTGNQWLDCIPPAGYGQVGFWVGSAMNGSQDLGNATPTYVGWLYEWPTASVEDGLYTIWCTAYSASGAEAISPTILVNVENPVS